MTAPDPMILIVNSGSTSVKLSVFDADGTQLVREQTDGSAAPAAALEALATRLGRPPRLIVHRLVHGGTVFTAPTRLEAPQLAQLAQLDELAPLHNPRARSWIEAAQQVFAGIAQAAVFDTAFFHDLPFAAREYALPERLRGPLGVRRYGFHGLAHEAMWRRFCELHPQLEGGGRLITLQLGGGCSMAALAHGAPQDTSMGFSPLEGLVMATRCGDIDASLVPFLARRLGIEPAAVLTLLNREAGLAGLSGGESSAGVLAQRAGAGSEPARQALEVYCHRARKYVGAYLAVLGGADGIVFGGGVGEHVAEVRRRILTGLEWAGIELDGSANEQAAGETRIDSGRLGVRVQVLPVAEETVMVRAGRALLDRPRLPGI